MRNFVVTKNSSSEYNILVVDKLGSYAETRFDNGLATTLADVRLRLPKLAYLMGMPSNRPRVVNI